MLAETQSEFFIDKMISENIIYQKKEKSIINLCWGIL
jgi:hypothetical protein